MLQMWFIGHLQNSHNANMTEISNIAQVTHTYIYCDNKYLNSAHFKVVASKISFIWFIVLCICLDVWIVSMVTTPILKNQPSILSACHTSNNAKEEHWAVDWDLEGNGNSHVDQARYSIKNTWHVFNGIPGTMTNIENFMFYLSKTESNKC